MRTWTTCPCPPTFSFLCPSIYGLLSCSGDTPIDTLEGHPSNASATSEGRVSEIRAKTSFRIASLSLSSPLFSSRFPSLSVFQANSICSSLPQDFLRSDGVTAPPQIIIMRRSTRSIRWRDGRSADPQFARSLRWPPIHPPPHFQFQNQNHVGKSVALASDPSPLKETHPRNLALVLTPRRGISHPPASVLILSRDIGGKSDGERRAKARPRMR